MNRVICVNGHYYDGDKYRECPHCAAGIAAVKQDPFAVRTDSRSEEKHSEKKSEKRADKKTERKKGIFNRKNRQEEKAHEEERQENDETLLFQDGAEPFPESQYSSKSYSGEARSCEPYSGKLDLQGSKSFSQSFSRGESGLGKEFSEVARRGEGKNDIREEGKTVGFFGSGKSMEPPVGYLICIAGEDFGTGFPLKSGNNSIGRSISMDVVILDEKVSREKQAFVMYEPHKREFYIKPGEGTGLCYVNDELVLGPMKLGEYDIIMLGDTRLMLIPVCCERFSWDAVDGR